MKNESVRTMTAYSLLVFATFTVALIISESAFAHPQSRRSNQNEQEENIGSRDGKYLFQRLRELNQINTEPEPEENIEVMPPPDDDESDDEWWKPNLKYHDGITVKVRDGGRHVRDIPIHAEGTSIAFSPDGLLYLGLEDGTIRVVESETGKERNIFKLGSAPITSLAFSNVGTYLFAGSPTTKKVYVWNTRKNEIASERKLLQPREIHTMKLSEDGYAAVTGYSGQERVLTGNEQEYGSYKIISEWYEWQPVTDPFVYVFKVIDGKLKRKLRGALPDGQKGMTSDGRLVLSNGQIWSIGSGKKSLKPLTRIPAGYSFSFTADGSQIVAVSDEAVEFSVAPHAGSHGFRDTTTPAVVRIFSSSTGAELRSVRPLKRSGQLDSSGSLIPEDSISSVSISPDGKMMAVVAWGYRESDSFQSTGDWNGMLNVVSIESGLVFQLPKGDSVLGSEAGNVRVLFSPDGKTLAAVAEEGQRSLVRIWDISSLTSK